MAMEDIAPGAPIVELRNIVKRFGSVEALAGVSLTVRKGEVLGLLGDNGAGKSTLVKTLAGVHDPDEGEIIVKGRRVSPWTPLAARNAGIETVFQDRALAPSIPSSPTSSWGARSPTRSA